MSEQFVESSIDVSGGGIADDEVHLVQVNVLGEQLTNELGEVVQQAPHGSHYVIVTASNGEEFVIQVDLATDLSTLSMADIESSQSAEHGEAETVEEAAPVLHVEDNDDDAPHVNEEVEQANVETVDDEDTELNVDEPVDDGARLVHPNRVKATGPRILKRSRAPDDIKPAAKLVKHTVSAVARRPTKTTMLVTNAGNMQISRQHTGVSASSPAPGGMKGRRSRVSGNSKCEQCDARFVNNARLERHMHVHQVFGSYLCPLCGKTYKYEYNLFYHWRKTCRELDNALTISREERKSMDTNKLRQLVDEATTKVANEGRRGPSQNANDDPMEMYEPPHNQRLDLPEARKGTECKKCGVFILAAHIDRHLAVHDGAVSLDDQSAGATWFCELCGLMFRSRDNLMKHWRGGCKEIQARINPNQEMTLNNDELIAKVDQMLTDKATQYQNVAHGSSLVKSAYGEEETIDMSDEAPPPLLAPCDAASTVDKTTEVIDSLLQSVEQEHMVDVTTVHKRDVAIPRQQQSSGTTIVVDGGVDSTGMARYDNTWNEQPHKYVVDGGAGAVGLIPSNAPRAKWSMLGGPVSCPDCYRTFANEGRLERHRQGFHNSYGVHHCILCGNRFKYDYNLLYHYRHSCPYTKAFIEEELRHNMDSVNIRKLVRQLSNKHVSIPPTDMDRMLTEAAVDQKKHQMGAMELAEFDDGGDGGYTVSECQLCSATFSTMQLLMKHMARQHPDYTIVPTDDNQMYDDILQMALPATDAAAGARVGDTLLMDNVEYTVVRNEPNGAEVTLHIQPIHTEPEETIIVQPIAGRNKGARKSNQGGPSTYPTNTVAHQLASHKMRDERSRPLTTLGEPIEAAAVNCEQCDKLFRTVVQRDRHVDAEHTQQQPSMLVDGDGRYRCNLSCQNNTAFRNSDAVRSHWTSRACSVVKANVDKSASLDDILRVVCQLQNGERDRREAVDEEKVIEEAPMSSPRRSSRRSQQIKLDV